VDLSIYVHVPFCRVRCAYCDFNTYAGLEGWMPAYVEAVVAELRIAAAGLAHPAQAPPVVGTIYFGGGTPSLLPPESVDRVLSIVRANFVVRSDAEITLEANPGTVWSEHLARLRQAGVNRLSLGAQSAQPDELRLLERSHSFDDVAAAVQAARHVGFDNVSLDLMYGLPRQVLATWRDTVEWALDLAPDHLSAYALSLENGTPMRAWVERGLVSAPDPDAAADMYEWLGWRLQAAGLVQYEISNWARDGATATDPWLPSFAGRHNLQYWRNRPYLGIGAGAHGYLGGRRYANVRSPMAYIERLQSWGERAPSSSPAAVEVTPVDAETEMDETMLLGLRLTREGVRWGSFRERFGIDGRERYGERLAPLAAAGLIEADAESIRLSPRGRLLGNTVFQAFV